MPYPQNQVYVRWDFELAGTPEIQVFGVWGTAVQEGVASFDQWGPLTQAIADQAVTAWLTMPTARFGSAIVARRAVAYHYDQTHEEVLDRAEAAFSGADVWQGSGTATLPPENSLVCSLYGYNPATYVPQRARKRGRIYPPTPNGGGLNPDGTFPQSVVDIYVGAFQGFFNTLTDVLDVADQPVGDETHFRPQVVSPTGQISTSVTHIRVGRVMDTQRRRRNKLAEEYRTLPINT